MIARGIGAWMINKMIEKILQQHKNLEDKNIYKGIIIDIRDKSKKNIKFLEKLFKLIKNSRS